jgi:hypothetical protein
MDRRERAQHVGRTSIEADLLVSLAKRRVGEVDVAGLVQTPRKRDLARMSTKLLRPLGEQQRGLGVFDEEGEDRSKPIARAGDWIGLRVQDGAQRLA